MRGENNENCRRVLEIIRRDIGKERSVLVRFFFQIIYLGKIREDDNQIDTRHFQCDFIVKNVLDEKEVMTR